MPYTEEKDVAIRAAIAAAQVCQFVRQERGSDAIEKPDQSPVTVADFAAQAVICQALQEAFPQDVVVGEESAALLRSPGMDDRKAQVTDVVQTVLPNGTSEQVLDWVDRGAGEPGKRFWVLDPIDGTKGFVRGDQYAIALALIEDGDIKVAVMGCPALPVDWRQPEGDRGVLFVAVRGQGSEQLSLNTGISQTIHVCTEPTMDSFRLIESVETDHGNPTKQRAIAQAVGITAPVISMDSQAKYSAVARGEADLYLRFLAPNCMDYRENSWDHAPGVLILEEAGGQVTDMHGKLLDFSTGKKLLNNQGVVASNGVLHSIVLKAFQEHTISI